MRLPVKGVFEKKEITKNIDLINELGSDKHSILVVGDGSNTYQVIEKEIRQQLQAHPSITASYLVSNNLSEITGALKNRTEKYLFLTTIGGIYGQNGNLLTLKSIINSMLQETDMSIISMEDAYLFDGVLGGYVTSGNKQGASAARLAIEYLKTGNLDAVENIIDSPNIYQFDQTVLQQQGISLPEEIARQAIFYNIPQGLYEKHRTLILSVLAILSVTIIFLASSQLRIRRQIKKQRREKELLLLERSDRYQNAIQAWSGKSYETIQQAFENATEISSRTLGIERVSVWLYNAEKNRIECQDLFSSTEGHMSGMTLDQVDFPAYFRALGTGRPLAIFNATTDQATSEFTDVYLNPNNIMAMLDIPLYYDGKVAGVLCHEHTGSTREWANYEIDFASTMASMVSLSLEVSKRKKIEQSLEEEVDNRTREAVEANAAKSAFLANMSHELRTPMHAIISYANLVIKSGLDEKGVRFTNNILTSAQRLTSLLDDLLDLSKLEAGKMDISIDEFNFLEVIHTHVNEVQSLLDSKKIETRIESDKNMTGCFDSKLMGQVITNLLSNAIKFSPESSTIIIRARSEKSELDGYHGKTFHVEVVDQGIGIPDDELEDIFDEFIQSSKTRTQSGGTGLGLPICKEIIHLHNGRIWAESPVGDNPGSAFHFIIPADCNILT